MHAQVSKFGADVFLFLGQPASQIGSRCYSFAKEEFESSKVKSARLLKLECLGDTTKLFH